MKRKRVLIIGNFLAQFRGSTSVCEELSEHLREIGWKVISASDKPNRVLRFYDMLRTVWLRRRDFDVAQVDVYSGRSFFWAEAVAWMLRRLKKPFILTLHGGNLPRFAERWPRRVKNLLQSADIVTTPAPYLKHELSQYRCEIRFIRNAIDLSRYPFVLREKLRPHLIWLRAFHRIYNPSLVPKALALLTDEYPDVRVTMVGPDKEDGSLQEMQRLATSLGVDDRITVVGGVSKSDVPWWLSRGDIFVNTTYIDSMPVSVVEAMACGMCVVSTDVGGLPYLVADGEDGLLVPANDAVATADAIRHLLRENDHAKQISGRARTKSEVYDWSSIMPQWDDILWAAQRG